MPTRRSSATLAPASPIGDPVTVPDLDDIWVPLVDEPIGGIVEEIQRRNPAIRSLVESPRRILAFRTFAYIRVGLVLGQLLFDNDLPPYDGSETWIETLLHEPAHLEAITREVRAVAEEIAADPNYADEGPLPAGTGRRRSGAVPRVRTPAPRLGLTSPSPARCLARFSGAHCVRISRAPRTLA
jgi:hypothetical protein